MKYLSTLLILGLSIYSVLQPVSSRADGDDPPELPWRIPITQWPNEYWSATRWYREDYIQDNIDSLFDFLNGTTLFSRPIKVNPLSNGSVSLFAGRKIYDNQDVRGTWTVVDSFEIKTAIPLVGIIPIGATGLNFGYSIGGNAGISFSDAKQIAPRDYENLPPLQDRIEEIGRSGVYRNLLQNQESPTTPSDLPIPIDDEVLIFKPKPSLEIERNREIRPQLTQIFNLAKFPFRFPFKADGVKKMSPQEILTINGTGMVQLAGSLGYGRIYSAGVSFTTLLNGQFRISILKETDRYVQVKLTRTGMRSHSFGFSTQLNETQIFDGDAFLSGIFILGDILSFPTIGAVPFSFSVSKSKLGQFDVKYRYDLTSEEGREAYEQAVLGRFSLSEKYAESSHDTTVQRVYAQRAHTSVSSMNISSAIQILFSFSSQSSRAVTEADIRLGSEFHQIFKASKMHLNKFNWWDWVSEQHSTLVSAELDDALIKKNDPEAMHFNLDTSHSDSHTRGAELNQYHSDMIRSIGVQKLFEHAPQLSPTGNPVYYGRSTFQYGIRLNRPELEKIWSLSRSEVKTALTQAWGRRPQSLARARYFLNNFDRIRAVSSLREKLRIWISLFRRPMKSLGHYRLTRLLLGKAEPLTKYYYANNLYFGSSRYRAQEASPIELVLARSARESSRDQPASFVVDNSQQTLLKQFRVDVPIDGRLPWVIVDSVYEPESIAVRLEQTDSLRSYKELVFVVAKNKVSRESLEGPFRIPAGLNQWQISPSSNSEIGRILAAHLRKGRFYTLTISLSRDGKIFGPAQKDRFYIRQNTQGIKP